MNGEEMTVNAAGGRQHKVAHRCEALFPKAILEVARLRAEGHDVHGYDDLNYLNISEEDHVGRALRHILLWQAGDCEDGSCDEHLVHAACRILMAVEMLKEKDNVRKASLERAARGRFWVLEEDEISE